MISFLPQSSELKKDPWHSQSPAKDTHLYMASEGKKEKENKKDKNLPKFGLQEHEYPLENA